MVDDSTDGISSTHNSFSGSIDMVYQYKWNIHGHQGDTEETG